MFINGCSIAQARQDAKRLSKSENIHLHQALDIIARKYGYYLSWPEAMESLRLTSSQGIYTTKEYLSAPIGAIQTLKDKAVSNVNSRLCLKDSIVEQAQTVRTS